MRREAVGGNRPDGHRRTRPVRRPDPRRLHRGTPDATLTGVAGLAAFACTLRDLGVDATLHARFDRLKPDGFTVYRMGDQLRLLLDLFACGEPRVFGLEALAGDPLFVRLAGGVVPSLDVVYDDLRRLDAHALAALRALVQRHGLAHADRYVGAHAHLDLDTTVTPLFGQQEGARPGPNPRYHGRPSYHPYLARLAELDTVVDAVLRPGDTAFGEADVPMVVATVTRVRAALPAPTTLHVRVDAAGECAALLAALAAVPRTDLTTKAHLTPDLLGAVVAHRGWRTVDVDASGRPTVQVATLAFTRDAWRAAGVRPRVVAVRSTVRDTGKRVAPWPGRDDTVQVFVTTDWASAEEDVAARYDARGGIEPLIADGKGGWGLGAASSDAFDANHALLLLKVLAWNLLRRHVRRRAPAALGWRTPWVRRVLITQPGRLTRSGRQWFLHVRPDSLLDRLLN